MNGVKLADGRYAYNLGNSDCPNEPEQWVEQKRVNIVRVKRDTDDFIRRWRRYINAKLRRYINRLPLINIGDEEPDTGATANTARNSGSIIDRPVDNMRSIMVEDDNRQTIDITDVDDNNRNSRRRANAGSQRPDIMARNAGNRQQLRLIRIED